MDAIALAFHLTELFSSYHEIILCISSRPGWIELALEIECPKTSETCCREEQKDCQSELKFILPYPLMLSILMVKVALYFFFYIRLLH